jgi:monoamine oxidase
VLEARDRVGGRVWTLREPPIAPGVIEAGGEFIDGGHKAIRQLISEAGLSLVRVLREGFGLALDDNGLVRVHRTQRGIWRRYRRALAPLAAEFARAQSDWDSSVAAAIASQTLNDALTARQADPDVCAMAQGLRGFFLADSDRLSALIGVELSLEDVDPGHVPIYRIRGGNDQLPLALTRGVDVRFSGRHVVRAVRQTAHDLSVTFETADGLRDRVHCDYAVITAPPPIFLGWEFDPPLPADQRRAFEALCFGEATKIVLRFKDAWWRKPRMPRAFGTNLPIGAVWESSEEQRGARCLTLLAGGRASAEVRDILASEGVDGVVRRLTWMGRPGVLEGAEEVVWDRDPFARGGYAFFSASFDPAWRDALARAFGRILFAGDHTSREWQGYMNGAVESGQRAARELAALEAVRRAAG